MSFKKNVLIPFGQSLVMGFFVGGAVMAILSREGKPYLETGISIALLTSTIYFGYLSALSQPSRPKKQKIPQSFEETVKINLLDNTRDPYTSGKYIETKISKDKLILLAILLSQGRGFSYSSLSGRGKIFSRSEYEQLRDQFIARGLLEWKNPDAHAQGLEITRGGMAFARHFSKLHPSSLSPVREILFNLRSSNAQAHASAHGRKTDLTHAQKRSSAKLGRF